LKPSGGRKLKEEIPDNFTLSIGEVEFNSTSLENGTNVIASP